MCGALTISVSVVNLSRSALANDEDPYSSWYFTSEEITAAYQYQQNYGERLRAPLPDGCAFSRRRLAVFPVSVPDTARHNE